MKKQNKQSKDVIINVECGPDIMLESGHTCGDAVNGVGLFISKSLFVRDFGDVGAMVISRKNCLKIMLFLLRNLIFDQRHLTDPFLRAYSRRRETTELYEEYLKRLENKK